MSDIYVKGYFKPEDSFHTISEWESISRQFLELQKIGVDTRNGMISDNPKLISLINKYFSYQLYIETERYPQLLRKDVLAFIENFVNHRVWNIKNEFQQYISNIDNDKIAFFFCQGSIEPYILMDTQFTLDTYGSNDIDVISLHWTSKDGFINIADMIKHGYKFAISTFTNQKKDFFDNRSNVLLKIKGKLAAAFESDAYTYATDRGNRAANMYRLSYPDNRSNLCRDWQECKEDKTSLWNEIIVYPTEILDYKIVNTY